MIEGRRQVRSAQRRRQRSAGRPVEQLHRMQQRQGREARDLGEAAEIAGRYRGCPGALDMGGLASTQRLGHVGLQHVVGTGGPTAEMRFRHVLHLEAGGAQQGTGLFADLLGMLQRASIVIGDPHALADALRDDIRAFVELHIEQGPVLERAGTAIGVVSAIVGITRIEVVFEGKSGHAGTVPMEGRRDALAAAAALVGWVKESATGIARAAAGHFVATTGVLQVEPNAPNVVPARARLVVDARSEDKGRVERFVEALRAECRAAAASQNVDLARFGLISDSLPVTCDGRLQRAIAQSAHRLGLSSMPMASGAGHDTSFLARICPAAMVFVPCREGLSHHADEWAEPADLAAGATVLLETIETIDRDGLG